MAPVVVMVDEPLLIVPKPVLMLPEFRTPTVVAEVVTTPDARDVPDNALAATVPPLFDAACAWFALANPVEEIVGVVRVRPARVADHAGTPDARCRTVLSAPLPSRDSWDVLEAYMMSPAA